MRLMLCFIIPPLAILLCGRPFLAFFSIFFTLAGVVPGIIVALYVLIEHGSNKRHRKSERAMDRRFNRLTY